MTDKEFVEEQYLDQELAKEERESLKLSKDELYKTFDWSDKKQQDKESELKTIRINSYRQELKETKIEHDRLFGQAMLEKDKNSADMIWDLVAYLSEQIIVLEKRLLSTKKETQDFDIDSIKKISLIEVLRSYNIEVKHIGINRSHCCCPFHEEKTPSCVIYEDQNSFYCYGCGKGGSVIDFIMFMKQYTFFQACRDLINNWNPVC